jgi:hypothetical protein
MSNAGLRRNIVPTLSLLPLSVLWFGIVEQCIPAQPGADSTRTRFQRAAGESVCYPEEESCMAEHAGFVNLQKHERVIAMLRQLDQQLGREAFQVVDHWESDRDAVGVSHPSNRELLAYIAVNGPEDFYVQLEVPPPLGSELPYAVAGEFRSLSLADVVQIVRQHLGSLELMAD